MITRYACWMDGQGLQDVDPALLILDIAESAPDTEVRTAASPLSGTRVTGLARRSLTVTVTFAVRETSPVRRAAVLERVAAWAQGTRLTVGHRPGQQLRCLCTALPAASALRWTAPLTVAFTAFASPYWESDHAACAWITPAALTGSAVLTPVGTAPAVPAEALVINQSGETVNTLRLSCGDTSFDFRDLALSSGERLLIDHDDHGRLRMMIHGETSRSVMDKRTPDSADELLAACRRGNAVTVQSDAPVTVKFTARGRFL